MLRLHKNEHWRLVTIPELLPQSYELSILISSIYEPLLHSGCCCISDPNLYLDRLIGHDLLHDLFDAWLHRCAEEEFDDSLIVLTIAKYRIYLL